MNLALPLDYSVGPGYVVEKYAESVTVVNLWGEQVSSCQIAYNAPIEASAVYMATLENAQESRSVPRGLSVDPVAMRPRLAGATIVLCAILACVLIGVWAGQL